MRGLPVAVCPHHPGGPPEGPIPGPALAPAGVPDPTRTGGAVPLPAGAPTTELALGPHRPAVPGQRDGLPDHRDGLPAQRDCFGGRTTWDSLAAIADLGEAEEYLRLFHTECPRVAGRLAPRLAQVRQEIAETGTYTHTPAELDHGVRVAWRNSSRCIGRLYWKSIRVLDRRAATGPTEIAEHLVTHLYAATNSGRIRPTISVFAPEQPGRPAPRVWNEQLIRYAGYRQPDGMVVGDPRYADFTTVCEKLGWRGAGGRFDVLPLVVEVAGRDPEIYDLPPSAVLQVPLHHPRYLWFAQLGLRWHAVPAISCMRLRLGGVDYPLAPFNGWYMGTEIGARNLADPDRYDLLPLVGRRLGLDTTDDATLWKDRALVELNVAVLHSFRQAGVTIADHHTESRRFLTHLEKERKAGRITPAEWSWIVPPISGAATPVFHRYYDTAELRPNFYLDDDARHRALGTV